MRVLYQHCPLDLKGEPLVHRTVRGIVRQMPDGSKGFYRHGLAIRLPGNRVFTMAWGTM